MRTVTHRAARTQRSDLARRASVAAALTLALAACGGQFEPEPETAQPVAAAMSAAATSAADAEPLFGTDGQPTTAARSHPPGDPSIRTRAGLYASAAQYAWEALLSSPYTVFIDLDAAGSVDAAVQDALAAHRWPGASPALAYYVQASDLRAGAALADRLSAEGLHNVFLIVERMQR